MNPRRLDARRRRILELMGVSVWTLRQGAAVGSLPSSDVSPEIVPGRVESSPVRPEPAGLPAVASAQKEEPAGSIISLSCLIADTVMMLVSPAPHVSRRFCRDVLAAASGRWNLEPRVMSFAWPDPGLAGGEVAGETQGWRAFKAFMERQLSESQTSILLCGESLIARLPPLPDGCRVVVLPDLAGSGVEAKRALWRELGTSRA